MFNLQKFKTKPEIVLLVFIAVFSRLIPHPPNMTAIFGAALFSGWALKNTPFKAVLLPLLALFISDFFIGFHDLMWATYLGVAVSALISLKFLKLQTASVLGVSFCSSFAFYLISNFGVWASSGGTLLYEKSFSGLTQCYIMALPFFQNSLISDLSSSILIFGVYFLWQKLVSPNLKSHSVLKN